MKAALFGRVCAWCSKAPVGFVFIGWSPVADRRQPNWTGSATALFQSRENGCDCRRATKHMAKTRRSAAFLRSSLTSEMGQTISQEREIRSMLRHVFHHLRQAEPPCRTAASRQRIPDQPSGLARGASDHAL